MAAEDAVAQDGVTAELPELGTAPEPVEVSEPAGPEEKTEAGIAEAEHKNHKVTWKLRGEEIEFQLPEKLLLSVVHRAGILRDDDIAGATKLSEAIIGREEFARLLDKMDELQITVDDEEGATSVGNLINDALAVYGVTPGESEAS